MKYQDLINDIQRQAWIDGRICCLSGITETKFQDETLKAIWQEGYDTQKKADYYQTN